jgi:hypothetical protein
LSPVPPDWTPRPAREPPPPPGAIEGFISYPSEGIPPTLIVCAQALNTGETYCTGEQIMLRDDAGALRPAYRLELPVGRYIVYATAHGLRGFYSESVLCGLHVSCPSNDPIVVRVISGQVVRGIDPADWYAPPD